MRLVITSPIYENLEITHAPGNHRSTKTSHMRLVITSPINMRLEIEIRHQNAQTIRKKTQTKSQHAPGNNFTDPRKPQITTCAWKSKTLKKPIRSTKTPNRPI